MVRRSLDKGRSAQRPLDDWSDAPTCSSARIRPVDLTSLAAGFACLADLVAVAHFAAHPAYLVALAGSWTAVY